MGLVLVYSILFILTYGSVIIITGFKYRDRKERLQQVGISAAISVVFFGLLVIIGIGETHIWNDGICSNCGGYYEFIDVAGHRHSTSYIYQCKNCNNVIELRCYEKPKIKN